MNSTIERLLNLRVADLMTRDIVKVSVSQSMAEAAKMLLERGVSGAPVVDELGHCVGILSTSDFMKREHAQASEEEYVHPDGLEHSLVNGTNAHPLHFEVYDEDRVSIHMSKTIQTISENTSALDAGRMMCACHIHRLPVVDDKNTLIGIISVLDLVAATIKAVEE